MLTTDEDCDLDEEDVDDDDEVVPPDPDEAGLALKALKWLSTSYAATLLN